MQCILLEIPHFAYSIHHLINIGVVSTLAVMSIVAMNIHVKVIV